MSPGIRVRRLHTFGEREITELAQVLIDCVEGGASVSFMLPLPQEKAAAYWRGVAVSVGRGERVVLAALDEAGVIVGTVQLTLNLPENQPHRADLAKMLVHRRARRQGRLASALGVEPANCASPTGSGGAYWDGTPRRRRCPRSKPPVRSRAPTPPAAHPPSWRGPDRSRGT